MYTERKYIVFPSNQLDLINFDEVLETSINSVVKSINGDLTFVKWNGNTPECVSGLTNTSGPYSHAEMLNLLTTNVWVNNEQN